jgi:HEAT repeat protein
VTFVLVLALLSVPSTSDSVGIHLNALKTSTDAQELQWAVYHLARSGDSAAAPAIREFLADTARYLEPDADSLPSPQGTAAFYLGELGDTAAAQVLKNWLMMEGHEKTRVEAAASLVRLGQPLAGLGVLERFVLDDSTPPKNRTRGVNVFFLPGDEPLVFEDSTELSQVAGMLRRVAERGEPYLRARALEWLVAQREIDLGEAFGIATRVMDSTRNEAARASALRVVMALGTEQARQRIEEATYDWQPDIRFAANRYLAERKREKETGNRQGEE